MTDTLSIRKVNIKSYVLCRMVKLPMTLSDPQSPQITSVFTFGFLLHVSGTA